MRRVQARAGSQIPHVDRRAIVGVTRLTDKPQAFSCKCDQCGAYSGPTAVASSASEIGFRVTCHKCGYVFDLTLRHEHGVPVPDLELMVTQGCA